MVIAAIEILATVLRLRPPALAPIQSLPPVIPIISTAIQLSNKHSPGWQRLWKIPQA
jgi:hypothetical protein